MPQPNPGMTEWNVVEAISTKALRDQLDALSAGGWTVFATHPPTEKFTRFTIVAFRIVAAS